MAPTPQPVADPRSAEVVRDWPELLLQLTGGTDLSAGDTSWAMDEIMSGNVSDTRIAGFLAALRTKGESVAEVEGLVAAMLDHAVPLPGLSDSVDIVGTGGDRAKTVNISSTAAMVISAAGYRVVKHGNRASSSASGAADILEALGIDLRLRPERVGELAHLVGITFCFANVFHPAMRHAAVARKELGIPTAFNLLGPLTNPARSRSAAIGVADLSKASIIAGVLAARGVDALVFRSADGLDELSNTAVNDVWEVRSGSVDHSTFDARSIGIPRAIKDDLKGGAPEHNAMVTRSVLAGESGPVRDVVALNAAAAMVAYDGASDTPLEERLAARFRTAVEHIDSGAASRRLDELVETSQKLFALDNA